MSWDLLQRFFDSDVFNQNPFLSVSYLTRYADHVGIHYVLCNKLRQFPYEDVEFFLPELCHLIISVNNESMALEEFLLDLCEESVSGALLAFWLFQSYLTDLSSNPHSEAFRTCRRVYNKVQHIVFGLGDTARHEKIKENPLPVTVLASLILSSVAVPGLPHWAGPLAVAQAKKPQPIDDVALEPTQPKIARAEVDIPVICPPTLTDGSPSRSKHHRVVRINPAEATVLNSAEKVPYLLMIEILRDDFTFDPDSQDNQRLLATLVAEQGSRRRIFDLSERPKISTSSKIPEPSTESADSVFEPSSGDLAPAQSNANSVDEFRVGDPQEFSHVNESFQQP
ncbi:Phosphatidylinositol 4-kinase pik1alpha (PI4-kinase)(PtdIns-4-kinase) [Diaporthe eres]